MTNNNMVVFDVGKTHSKLTLWSATGHPVARQVRANERIATPHYLALDVAGITAWAGATLTAFARLGPVTDIIPVGHGAAAVIVRDGALACAPLDYEQPLPEAVASRYTPLRDDFSLSGCPRLPNGLNLGAQLYWLEELFPSLLRGSACIIPWAQYWAWVLCGVAASEETSLGCHTDLWRPHAAEPSALARERGWAARLAPLKRADAVLGTLRPAWVEQTGLPAQTRIRCGIHDSNAALLAARGFAEIADHEATVISTGTWFLAMRSPRNPAATRDVTPAFAENRDCLINVDAGGLPTPSARFMGGREIELLTVGDAQRLEHGPDQAGLIAALPAVVHGGHRILPTLAPGVGPYPHAPHRWEGGVPAKSHERRAAIGLYVALVMNTSLDLLGARERILVEGRFAESEVFVRALASLRPEAAVYASNAHDGVPYGALRLVTPTLPPPGTLRPIAPLGIDIAAYAKAWRGAAERLEAAA